MNPFFSIITPTLQRDSLEITCASVDEQTIRGDWEHLVQVDCDCLNDALIFEIAQPLRRVVQCDRAHHNGGNTCRREALERATGDWVYFLDDDNYLADKHVLLRMRDLLVPLSQEIKWAIFPILRLGNRFYADPPRSCHTDTGNFVLRREIAYWPDTDAYGTDGMIVEDLMARKIPYAAFPNESPIMVMPKISFGK